MRRFLRDNGLSVVFALLFLVGVGGMSVAGHRDTNASRRDHGLPEQSWSAYVMGDEFLEALAENWESEFLQMGMYVVLTAFLFQKGSSESKDPEKDEEPEDRTPDPNRPRAPGPVRRGGLALTLYKHSLSIAFLVLFLATTYLHAVGGAGDYNQEQAAHGRPADHTALSYLGTSRFWFESLQNWQSEFLAVLAIVMLSIWLRQQGSPESKPVDAAHDETGRS